MVCDVEMFLTHTKSVVLPKQFTIFLPQVYACYIYISKATLTNIITADVCMDLKDIEREAG